MPQYGTLKTQKLNFAQVCVYSSGGIHQRYVICVHGDLDTERRALCASLSHSTHTQTHPPTYTHARTCARTCAQNRKPQSPYGQLPPQNFPFPHSTAAGGLPSSEEYGAKAPVYQLKMKKPCFHREGKFAKKTQQLYRMAAGNKDKVFHPDKVDPISADIAYIAAHRKERSLGFTF